MRSFTILLLAVVLGAGAVGSQTASAQTFSSAVWQLKQLPTGGTYSPASNYAIQFLSDHSLAIYAECGRASGTWSSPNGSSSLNISITLNVGCTKGQTFLRYLTQTSSYGISGSELTLVGPGGKSMLFQAAPL